MAFKFLTDYSHEEVAAKRQRQEIQVHAWGLEAIEKRNNKTSQIMYTVVVRGRRWLALVSGHSADTCYSYSRTRRHQTRPGCTGSTTSTVRHQRVFGFETL